MSIVSGSMRRPVTVTMLTLSSLVFGFVALDRLPLNLLPDISYPTLTIRTEYADAAPAEVEKLITEPLEDAVSVVRGLRGLRSVSRPGVSEVTLEFGWKTDMDYAGIDVREKIDLVTLPDDVQAPTLLRFDPSLDPILRLGLHGDQDPITLRHMADQVLKKDLESLIGVASVRVQGGLEEEIHVEVDEGKLAALGIPISTVSQFLRQQNLNSAGGRLRDRDSEFLVRTLNEFERVDDLAQTVLYEEGGRRVLLEDVATIGRGHKERQVLSKVRGEEAVELSLYKEGDANTVQVARAVKKRVQQLRRELPEGMELQVLADQSVFIEQSINEVRDNAIVGGLLAMIVLFLFLKQSGPTFIISVTIPISIVATFFVMQQLGVSLNVMSLGGLALGVGMLVDNAIVVLEAIQRRRAAGQSVWDATEGGTNEVARAVTASTMTTVAVFVPIIFVEGIAGQIFGDQALTVTASQIISLIAGLALIPVLSSVGHRSARFALRKAGDIEAESEPASGLESTSRGGQLHGEDPSSHDRMDRLDTGLESAVARRANPLARIAAPFRWIGRVLRPVGVSLGRYLLFPASRWTIRSVLVLLPGLVIRFGRFAYYWIGRGLGLAFVPLNYVFDRVWGRVEAAYPKHLRWALGHRGTVFLVVLLMGGVGLALFPRLGSDLVPEVSQGEFTFDLELPPGSTLRQTERAVAKLEERLANDPRVAIFFSRIGESPDAGNSAENRRENLAQLNVAIANPGDAEEERAVIDSIRETLGGTDLRYTVRRPTLFSFKTPVEIHVYGFDLAELETYSTHLAARVAEVPGLKDVRTNLEEGSPEVQIAFDRDRLASFDLDVESVAQTLRNKIRGDVATRLKERDRQLDILVRTAQADELDVSQVRNLVVSQVEGVPIPLSSVASVDLGQGPSEITHLDQHRAAVVTANLDGRDLGSVTADIRKVIRENPAPPALAVALGGHNDEVSTSFRSLMLALGLAAFLVYMVMASQFESFLHPLVIMLTVPLGLVGVVYSLALTGTSISVVVLIGVVLLTGIVVNNAIVLIDFINQRRSEGLSKLEAIVDAGRARIRPILMTTATTVLGLLPMALGIGEGAELRAPMAITVIGGMTLATVLTLVVIPVIYATVDRKA